MAKFKVGDLVRLRADEDSRTYEILRVTDTEYTVKTTHDGLEWDWMQFSCDEDILESEYQAGKQFDKDLQSLLEE